MVGGAAFFLEDMGGEVCSFCFPAFRSCCILWLTSVSFWPPLVTSHLFLWLWLCGLPYIGTLLIKLSNLPILRSLTYHIWKGFFFFFSYHAKWHTGSENWDMEILEGHYSANHSLPLVPKGSHSPHMPDTFILFQVYWKSQLINVLTQIPYLLLNLIISKSQISSFKLIKGWMKLQVWFILGEISLYLWTCKIIK